MSELTQMSGVAQASLVRERKVSRSELLAAHVALIEKLNPALSAFADTTFRQAKLSARLADSRRQSARSALDGAVSAVKDLNLARGSFTRFGATATRWFISPTDDVIVSRMRQAGIQLVGKLATSELGTMPVTEPLIHAPTRNPRDTSLSAGGSSGGSGSAVASGMLPFAHGSDGAGSIRIPASFCGIWGYKSTHSLVPNPSARVDINGLANNGPLARRTEDLAALVDILANLRGDASLLARLKQPIGRKLRIRVATASPVTAVDPEVAAAVLRLAQHLERAGHHLEEGAWMDGRVEEFLPIWQRQVANIPLPSDKGLSEVTRWLRVVGRTLDRAQVKQIKNALEQRILTWFGDADLWISPTTPTTAPKIGAFSGLDGGTGFLRMAPLGSFTAIFNITGQPAANVPMARHSNGAPIGVQIAARSGDDVTLLRLLHQLEAELPLSP